MSDDQEIGMDRDTSAPKDKMKKKIPRTLNNRQSESKNNIEKSPSVNEKENEKEEIEEEEEEEDEEEKNDKINKNENNKILNSSNSNKINDEEKNEELNLKVIVKNSENIEMVDVMCQANLTNNYENNKTIQELNLKIKTLENEKETLISQLKENQKKYEEKFAKQNKDINNLSLLNNKLKKNLDKVNIQVSKLLNQVVSNNTIPASNSNSKKETKIEKEKALNSSNNKLKNNEENKDSNVEIKILNEKLKFKESLIKDSQQTIEFLKKENKKLKEDYDSITSDGKTINQNHKLIQEIKKKNNEIRELEKDYKNLISSKSETKQIEYYKNKVKDLQTQNEENKTKINNYKQMLEKYQKKEGENKNNPPAKNLNSLIVKNNDNAHNAQSPNDEKISIINKIKIKKEGKSEYIVNELNSKKYLLNKNFSLLFNDFEKKTLFTLFLNEGDFEKFNQKLDIIDNNFNSASKRFQSNINELKRTVDDKDELILYLREKVRENEMKIKILLNQIHLERNKNEKRANNQKLNEKTNNLNKSRAKSPKKDNN